MRTALHPERISLGYLNLPLSVQAIVESLFDGGILLYKVLVSFLIWCIVVNVNEKEIISKYLSSISKGHSGEKAGFKSSATQRKIAFNRERNKLEAIMSKQIIHGENAIMAVEKVPEGLNWHTETKAIIGHSETGHHHLLEAAKGTEYELAELNGVLYLRLTDTAKVIHKKSFEVHEAVTLDPGVYQVTHKTEYDPFLNVRRAVYD